MAFLREFLQLMNNLTWLLCAFIFCTTVLLKVSMSNLSRTIVVIIGSLERSNLTFCCKLFREC